MKYLFKDKIVDAEEITEIGIGKNKDDVFIGYALTFKSGKEIIFHAENAEGATPEIGDFFVDGEGDRVFVCPAEIFNRDYKLIEE